MGKIWVEFNSKNNIWKLPAVYAFWKFLWGGKFSQLSIVHEVRKHIKGSKKLKERKQLEIQKFPQHACWLTLSWIGVAFCVAFSTPPAAIHHFQSCSCKENERRLAQPNEIKQIPNKCCTIYISTSSIHSSFLHYVCIHLRIGTVYVYLWRWGCRLTVLLYSYMDFLLDISQRQEKKREEILWSWWRQRLCQK